MNEWFTEGAIYKTNYFTERSFNKNSNEIDGED